MPDFTDDHFPTLGILGGGQLGRMMALAAIPMGIHVRLLSPKPAGPMREVGHAMVADWTDPEVLRDFAGACDVVTVESEWAPADRLLEAAPDTTVWPHPDTVHTIRHKGRQKEALGDAGLPMPSFTRCATLSAARDAVRQVGFPALLKKYEGSYDGYGNATVRSPEDVEAGWDALAAEDGLLVEAFAPFVRELAVLIARRPDGQSVTYPVVFTLQEDHRCKRVEAPAAISETVRDRAQAVAHNAVEAVDGVGITAVELFEMEDGQVLVNELAPRPHNTGHYTIEGCRTSQFANHVRAVMDLPLGPPTLRDPVAVMANVLGTREGRARPTGWTDALGVPGAAVYIYGKPAVYPERKLGHVTVTGSDRASVRERAERAAGYLTL